MYIFVPTHLKGPVCIETPRKLCRSDKSNVSNADGMRLMLHHYGRLPYCGNFAHRCICKRRLKSSHLMT